MSSSFQLQRSAIAATAFAIAMSVAGPVHAEVMDKEPALVEIWAWALAACGLGLVGWRFRWWLGALAALIGLPFFVAVHSELRDPFVGPAISAEAGPTYVWSVHLATLAFLVAHGIGAAGWARRRRASNGATVFRESA